MGVTPRFNSPGQFDRYCKLVLEHEAIDYLRKMDSLHDRQTSLSVLPQREMDKLSTVDSYPSESHIFTSHGCDLPIENELVAEAFAGLTEQEQSILILHCVLGMSDSKIGTVMELSRYAVQRRNYILSNTDNNLSISNINKQTSQSQNTSGEFFASYQINKKNRIGGGLSISADKHNENNVTETSSLIQSKIDDGENRSSYVQPWSKPYLFYKLYYLLATDSKGSFLDISGIYRHGRNESNAKYNFSPDADEWRSNNTSGGSATISYTQIFNQKHTLKGGYNF